MLYKWDKPRNRGFSDFLDHHFNWLKVGVFFPHVSSMVSPMDFQSEIHGNPAFVNGNSRILKWRYVSTIFEAIFCEDIPVNIGLKNRPKVLMVGSSNFNLGS